MKLEAEDSTGKALNEAISIISVSIGITEERARKLLQLDAIK